MTAITDSEEVAVKHIFDSLLLLSFAPYRGRTLDFGSGAGYPGIPLAAALPESRFVLLESSAKKCAFLSHACAMLDLRNAEVLRGRLTAGTGLSIGRFEQVVTRAALPPRQAAALLVPHLSADGRLLLMTGPGKEMDRQRGREGTLDIGDALPPGCVCMRRKRFILPMGMGWREILEITEKPGNRDRNPV